MGSMQVVYVSRNAKDACVSAYYHAANPHKQGYPIHFFIKLLPELPWWPRFPFDAWVKDWACGLFEHGTWFAHVAGWRMAAAAHPDQAFRALTKHRSFSS